MTDGPMRIVYSGQASSALSRAVYWAHSMGPQRSPLSRVVVVVVDIDAQAACDSSDTW